MAGENSCHFLCHNFLLKSVRWRTLSIPSKTCAPPDFNNPSK